MTTKFFLLFFIPSLCLHSNELWDRTVLNTLIQGNKVAKVEEFLKEKPDLIDGGEDRNPLIVASEACNKDVIELLIKKNAVVGYKAGKKEIQAIHIAAKKCGPEVLQKLVGAQVDAQDIDGKTPLMYAVQYNQDTNAIVWLLSQGASPSHVDKKNFNVATYALKNKDAKWEKYTKIMQIAAEHLAKTAQSKTTDKQKG